MKNIAVTGASGFIGSSVVCKLKRAANIKIFNRRKHNLLDPDSLKNFVENQDVIIHLAGVNRGTNLELVRVNTLGTLCLLEAIIKYAPNARVVFASTFQVYLPQSLYGLSKKFTEELLIQYGLNYKIQSAILRLSNVYGPGGKPFYNSAIATFAHQIKQGESLHINGDGSQERDYIYIDDAVEAFTKAALYKQKETTKIVDICSGKSTSLCKIIKTMEGVSGKKIKVVYNNAVAEKPWPTEGKNFANAKDLLGWEPKTTLKQGLTKVLE